MGIEAHEARDFVYRSRTDLQLEMQLRFAGVLYEVPLLQRGCSAPQLAWAEWRETGDSRTEARNGGQHVGFVSRWAEKMVLSGCL